MSGFLKQNLNFSFFYQNLIKTFFFKNSKRTWLGKISDNKKWPETLISEHLVAVNPCELQSKKPDFHVSRVKSRNNQIWIFLFEGFNLAPPHLKFLGLKSWPPSARKVPILANFEADLKKYTSRKRKRSAL
jgi:hypothetical protein